MVARTPKAQVEGRYADFEQMAQSDWATERLTIRQISTDRQIDQLVYKLYDLTDDEIKIVEEATK